MSTSSDDVKPKSNPAASTIQASLKRMPILTGSENYRRWAGAWEIVLEDSELFGLITGEITEPETKDSDGWRQWKRQNVKLRKILLNAVDEDLQTVVIDSHTAHEAWNLFKARYDRDTTNTTISLLKYFINLSLNDGESIPDHLSKFTSSWNRLKQRSQTTKSSLGRTLRTLTSDDEIKGAFLLCSLPKTMDNLVDNLATKELTSFEDVQSRLLDLTGSTTNYSIDNTAYKSTEKDEKECSWCKSKKMKYQGHLYTSCQKLKKHQEKKNQRRIPKPTEIAGAAAHESEFSDHALISNSSTVTSTKWIFDTGASTHMTGCESDFESLTQVQGQSVKIANNTYVPITGKGTVRLNLLTSTGEVLNTVLHDVMLVPSFQTTRLYSWDKAREQGYKLRGEKDNIFLIDSFGHEVLWAKSGNKAYYIQTKKYNANLATYLNLHEALGHPSTTAIKKLF